jgi:hypothetical protein
MIQTGKIYGIFPVKIINNEPNLYDCFINNHFMWLFKILCEIEGLASAFVGVDHMFIIKIDKVKKSKKKKVCLKK